MIESIKNPIREQAKILSAQEDVCKVFARYWASAIIDTNLPEVINQWQLAYEQDGHKQQSLWGYIYVCKYNEMLSRQDALFNEMVGGAG